MDLSRDCVSIAEQDKHCALDGDGGGPAPSRSPSRERAASHQKPIRESLLIERRKRHSRSRQRFDLADLTVNQGD